MLNLLLDSTGRIEVSSLLLLVGVGIVAGAINVIAGGGSFLTLPILIFLGLPPGTANGTNRIGIILQNTAATWSFSRKKVMDWGYALRAAAPATAGAGIGAWMGVSMADESFKLVLALLMLAVSLASLWSPAGKKDPELGVPLRPKLWPLTIGYFLVGVYGGFVQAGVGFLILAVAAASGLDLVRSNAIKVFTALMYSLLSLLIFAGSAKVDWRVGVILGTGTMVGSMIGVRATVLKGNKWLKKAVTVCMVLFAVRLLFWAT